MRAHTHIHIAHMTKKKRSISLKPHLHEPVKNFPFKAHFRKKAPDTFKFLRHVMRAILSVRPKCSHRCVSRKEISLKPVQILKHATRKSTEQTSMRTKWFKHIAI